MDRLVFVAAAVLFWLSWLLMPGVGVTDPEQIFALVASQRPLVATSVVVQLLSAGLYGLGLVGVVSDAELSHVRSLRLGVALLLVGAMGSAADAVLHLLAYAMTAPGLERGSLVRVMSFMQGPGLLLLAPLIVSFFLGGGILSLALASAGVVSRWNPRLRGMAVATAAIGGVLAASELLSARAVGLISLAAVSGAQAWIGVALWKRARSSSVEASGRGTPTAGSPATCPAA